MSANSALFTLIVITTVLLINGAKGVSRRGTGAGDGGSSSSNNRGPANFWAVVQSAPRVPESVIEVFHRFAFMKTRGDQNFNAAGIALIKDSAEINSLISLVRDHLVEITTRSADSKSPAKLWKQCDQLRFGDEFSMLLACSIARYYHHDGKGNPEDHEQDGSDDDDEKILYSRLDGILNEYVLAYLMKDTSPGVPVENLIRAMRMNVRIDDLTSRITSPNDARRNGKRSGGGGGGRRKDSRDVDSAAAELSASLSRNARNRYNNAGGGFQDYDAMGFK